jgi:hypothetical protein
VSFGSGQQPTAHFDVYDNSTSAALSVTQGCNVGNMVTLKTTGNVTKVVVDGSGNVGIGTGVPLAATHIVANTDTTGTIVDQMGVGAIIELKDAGASKVIVDANGNMGIGTTVPTAKLHVIGNILQSNFIAFHVVHDGGSEEVRGTNAITLLNTTLINNGNCFNTTTGLFTPTVRGYYFYSATLQTNNGRSFQLRLNASNSTTGTKYAATGSQANPGSSTLSAVIYMNGTTDFVGLYPSSASITYDGVIINSDSHYCGYLIAAA